ncbi:hypothetical protein [Trichloromonas sp.]|uniref:hypothetical protein n=1 Tax=Trichloromonas sp. TaxID=3069249 RepID=UPI002A3A7C91|nr:hypothetical protein [Trichloromonas sp.]
MSVLDDLSLVLKTQITHLIFSAIDLNLSDSLKLCGHLHDSVLGGVADFTIPFPLKKSDASFMMPPQKEKIRQIV